MLRHTSRYRVSPVSRNALPKPISPTCVVLRWADSPVCGTITENPQPYTPPYHFPDGPPIAPSSPTLLGIMDPFARVRSTQASTYSSSHCLYLGSWSSM